MPTSVVNNSGIDSLKFDFSEPKFIVSRSFDDSHSI